MLDTTQQIGLVVINLVIGITNDRSLASAANPEGYRPSMLIFSTIALLAVVCAIMLRQVEGGPRGHGLETITVTRGCSQTV